MKKLLLFSINKQTLRKKELQQQAEGTAKQGKYAQEGLLYRICTNPPHPSLLWGPPEPLLQLRAVPWWAATLGKNSKLELPQTRFLTGNGPARTIWNSLSPYLLSTSFFRRGNSTKLTGCAADSLSDCLVAVAHSEDFLQQFKTKSRGKFTCARAHRCTQPRASLLLHSIMRYICSLRNSESCCSMPRPVPDGWKCQEFLSSPMFFFFFFLPNPD